MVIYLAMLKKKKDWLNSGSKYSSNEEFPLVKPFLRRQINLRLGFQVHRVKHMIHEKVLDLSTGSTDICLYVGIEKSYM